MYLLNTNIMVKLSCKDARDSTVMIPPTVNSIL